MKLYFASRRVLSVATYHRSRGGLEKLLVWAEIVFITPTPLTR